MTKFTFYAWVAVTVFLMSASLSFSQNTDEGRSISGPRSYILYEDFSGATFPPAYWTIQGGGETNWTVDTTSMAGGTKPEAVFVEQPAFNGQSRLVTPVIATSPDVPLMLQFNHFLYNYKGGYSIKVETTSDGITWNEVWVKEVTTSISPETVYVTIDNEDVGSDNFQLAFTFSGRSIDLTSWNIDNIMLFERLTYDIEATQVLVPPYAGSINKIKPIGMVSNKGTQTISFNAGVDILDAASTVVYSKSMNVVDVLPLESRELYFPEWAPITGVYTVHLTTTLENDENTDNDMVSSFMEIMEGVVFKKPLYEEFTSSTCGPCALQNPPLDAVLAGNPLTHSLIKYQVDWPGMGDPYYIPECRLRTQYYENLTAPKLYINSKPQWVAGMTQKVYNTHQGILATINIEIATAVILDDNTVIVEANITALEAAAAGLKAHIAIVQKTTTGNTGTNGETEFHNVLMKMLPDADGTTLEAMNAGDMVTLSETYNMSGTFMEDPSDLLAVIFVQDDNDRTVLQSEMAHISITTEIENNPLNQNTVTIYPNPSSDRIYLNADLKIDELTIFNLMGQLVHKSAPNASILSVDVKGWTPGIYLFKVRSEHNSMVKRIIVN